MIVDGLERCSYCLELSNNDNSYPLDAARKNTIHIVCLGSVQHKEYLKAIIDVLKPNIKFPIKERTQTKVRHYVWLRRQYELSSKPKYQSKELIKFETNLVKAAFKLIEEGVYFDELQPMP